MFAENTRDGYHVPFVHPFFRKASPPGTYNLLENGHAVQRLGVDPKGMEPELWEKIRKYPLPGVEEGEGYIVNLFPDMTVTLRYNMISLDWQTFEGPDRIVLHNRTLGLKATPRSSAKLGGPARRPGSRTRSNSRTIRSSRASSVACARPVCAGA